MKRCVVQEKYGLFSRSERRYSTEILCNRINFKKLVIFITDHQSTMNWPVLFRCRGSYLINWGDEFELCCADRGFDMESLAIGVVSFEWDIFFV